MRKDLVFSILLSGLVFWSPAVRATGDCKLALVLAIDVSGSVNWDEYRLQMRGLSEALRAADIAHAIRFPGNKGIMATVIQWSGEPHQRQIVPWSYLSTQQSITEFADKIDAAERSYRNFSTAIGNALIYSASQFGHLPRTCARRAIDVSGDGRSNEGINVVEIRNSVAASGITINGLAIKGADKELTDYYRANVIGGPNAFVLSAESFKDYPETIRRKLLREISPPLALQSNGAPAGNSD
ncbi:MAG: DUF1194 domain-containing protein [Hyphomicrobiales bacterium]